MKTKNLIISILIVSLFIGMSSCSSDSNDDNQTNIAVTTSDFTTSINENPVNGQVIGVVEGTTNQGSVAFSITEQTPSGAFTIDNTTGELMVADASIFDFEVNQTITGIVKVANGSVFENSNVVINIIDVNEVNIFNGNVTLNSQQEVDDFGSHNYTGITGYLVISGLENWFSITDLSPLNSLTTIGDDLWLRSNYILPSLEGLNNITSVGDFLTIDGCKMITNLTELQNLTSVGGGMSITGNSELTNLLGLSNTVANNMRYLSISLNTSLTNLNGLENVTSHVDEVYVYSNDALTNIEGLSNVTTILDGLTIRENVSLTNLNGLSNLTTLGDWVFIINNTTLTDFCGLNEVVINGDFSGGAYNVYNNAYNPTVQDIIDGNCSL